MCGIGGMYRFGETPIRGWQLNMLASSLEYRGNDATGLAIMKMDGSLHYYKINDPAWRAIASKGWQDFLRDHLGPKNQVRIALVHTRKATKGSPHKPHNNHPIVFPSAGPVLTGAVVHNGWINNDDALFERNKTLQGFTRGCDTDSDAIRALLDCRGGIVPELIPEMSLLDGVAAVGAIHPATPDKLLLLRDGNPLMLGSTEDLLYFASDKRAIHRASKPWVQRHGVLMQVHAPDVAFIPMNNKSGYIYGPRGLEFHHEFECVGRQVHRDPKGTCYAPMTDYHQRQERFAEQAKPKELPPIVKAIVKQSEKPHGTTTQIAPGVTTIVHDSSRPERDPKALQTEDRAENPRYVMCPNDTCQHIVDFEGSEFESTPLEELMCGACQINLAQADILGGVDLVN